MKGALLLGALLALAGACAAEREVSSTHEHEGNVDAGQPDVGTDAGVGDAAEAASDAPPLNCDGELKITGNVTLIGGSPIEVEAPPDAPPPQHAGVGITEIGGNLTITEHYAKDLRVLSCLRRVTGDVKIGSQPICATNHGCMRTSHNAMTSLQGLERLEAIGGALDIRVNEHLASVSGLSSLKSVGSLYVAGNPLPSLAGLEGLTSIGGELHIVSSSALASLVGLEGLHELGSLRVEIAALGSLAPLSGVRGDLAAVYLYQTGVVDLAGLEGTTIHDLSLSENPNLKSLAGVEMAASSQNIYLRANPRLASIAALGTLTRVDGSLEVLENEALASLTGLEGLTAVTGIVRIGGTLTSLSPLSGLRGRVGGLYLYGALPADLTGLEGITGVDDALAIGLGFPNWYPGTTGLKSLTGLDSVVSVGSVTVRGNQMLTSLDGLTRFESTTVAGLEIVDNPVLSSLGLTSLMSVAGSLSVHDNATLPQCQVDALATRLGTTCTNSDSATPCEGNDGVGACRDPQSSADTQR